MATYQKLPVQIEAIQWTDTEKSAKEIYVLMGTSEERLVHSLTIDQNKFSDHVLSLNQNGFKIETLEGLMTAKIGDYIIKGVKGEFYPCDEEIFNMTYVKTEQFDFNLKGNNNG